EVPRLLVVGRFARPSRIVLYLVVLAAPFRAGADGPPPGSVGPDSLSIAECVRIARELSPGVRAAAAERRAADFDSISVWRARRLGASLFTDATVAPRGSYDPTFTDLGQYQLKAGVELSILDAGARRRDRERAALGVRSAALTLEQARRDAGLRTAELAIQV